MDCPLQNREDMKDILILSMVSEAFEAMGQGIISDFITMDLAASLGVGFPDCWHGPGRYVSCRGVSNIIERMKELNEKFAIPCMKPPAELLRLQSLGVEKGLV